MLPQDNNLALLLELAVLGKYPRGILAMKGPQLLGEIHHLVIMLLMALTIIPMPKILMYQLTAPLGYINH